MFKILLLVLMLLSLFAPKEEAQVVEEVGNGIIITYNDRALVGYDEDAESQDLVIPPTVTVAGEEYVVERLGISAFADCENLSTVELPEGLTDVGIFAFSKCKNLTSIHIPSSCTYVGAGAFNNCYALEEITVAESNTVYESVDGVLYSKQDTLLRCPRQYTGTLQIPDGVHEIGQSAVSCCELLTEVEIPDSVEKIRSSAFFSCTKITLLDIPDSVSEIYSSAFQDCELLTRLYLPNGLETIPSYMCDGCTALTILYIPKSVKYIDKNAFSDCPNLARVYYEGSEEDWYKLWWSSYGDTNEAVFNQAIIVYNYSKED